MFGVPLSSTWRCSVVQCGHHDVAVPKFLADAINFLQDYLTLEGIFRKAGSLTRLKEIKVKLTDNSVSYMNVHVCLCIDEVAILYICCFL